MTRFTKVVGTLVLSLSAVLFAQPAAEDVALAKESEVYCASTAETKATPELIKEKVAAAAIMLNKEGKAGFKKLKGKGSEYLFAGTYIWIHDFNNKMIDHPIKPALVGKMLAGLKDGNGKLFFVEMTDKVKKNGDGWVSYTWPKPGEKTRSLKCSYVKKATVDGEDLILGCGTYDLTEEEVKKLTGE